MKKIFHKMLVCFFFTGLCFKGAAFDNANERNVRADTQRILTKFKSHDMLEHNQQEIINLMKDLNSNIRYRLVVNFLQKYEEARIHHWLPPSDTPLNREKHDDFLLDLLATEYQRLYNQ